MLTGIINVWKEAGMTSFDVVSRLRRSIGQKKIGHTGTLDPMAIGVLPVALGKATKICSHLEAQSKTYRAVLRLGLVTDTEDMTGTVLQERPVAVTEQDIRRIMSTYVGDYLQIPPMYSAIKMGGKKLYQLARQGIEVERQPRPRRIYRLEIEEISLPFVTFSVECSKGTYIRTLCADIGKDLGCGAAMDRLVRTRVGCCEERTAHTLEQLAALATQGELHQVILPIEEVLPEYSRLQVAEEEDKIVHNGGPLERPYDQDEMLVYDSGGTLIGLYAWQSQKRRYKPRTMFYEGGQV
ncbi:MAG: tRNA pseudouridine(55) synthase TruB [Lachnospiraceae bacterium]|nr:tRNA pseudouridine(55) synthase TruB [Lachnospiraceae bacterium]MDY5742638.1 tRNA pseudouridine(55) synthase TruB [Lachnospiraceae bacterium]